MPMYRQVLYYIYIYICIYIYSLSVGRGGFILGVSAGCQPPLLQGVAGEEEVDIQLNPPPHTDRERVYIYINVI